MKVITIMQIILHNVNVPRVVCEHLIGEQHSHKHRMAVGGFVMVCGVYIAKMAAHCHFAAVEMGADLFGYLVHGVGAVPYVDALVLLAKQTSPPNLTKE